MSYLVAGPDYVTAAATDLSDIGSSVAAANAAAAGPTSKLLAAGADEISAAVASLFSGHAQAFQSLSAQAEQFHQQFVQLLNTTAGSYTAAEAANASLVQTVQQGLQSAINAPLQTLGGGTPIAGLNNLLTGGLNSLPIAGVSNLLTGGLSNLPITGLNNLLPGGLNIPNLAGLNTVLTGGLNNLLPGGLNNLLSGGLNIPNLGGLANVPYNLFANIVNIPYYESLALQEYAFALGPAGSVGGVPGWIPPGATVANGGVKMINGLPYYALGGTGSWWEQSIGNTWGWDDGNWPQLDAIMHFFLPFAGTEFLAEQVQTIAQANFIPGADLGNEFEGTSPLAYIGRWMNGTTPISSLLSGTTFPTVLTNTIGQNSSTGVINVGPPNPPGNVAIWSGEPAQLQTASLQGIVASLTASPAENPIMFPDPTNVFSSAAQLTKDLITDFNPFATGSFLYWGAPTDYSVPSIIGGTLQEFTGIPNQFPLANNGAEPLSGYTAGPSSLLTGLPEGGQYLAQGLQGYLNPDIYVQAVNSAVNLVTDPAALRFAVVHNIPLLGYVVDTATLGG